MDRIEVRLRMIITARSILAKQYQMLVRNLVEFPEKHGTNGRNTIDMYGLDGPG
ncbi:MAG TPA: hypothetical protein VNI77_01405 [Nitrososphaera sp.]|nr:hypothetical protein [Nitrososphaera sp.]